MERCEDVEAVGGTDDGWVWQRGRWWVGGTAGTGDARGAEGDGGAAGGAAREEEQPIEEDRDSAVEVAAEPRADEHRADEQQQQRGGDADERSAVPADGRSAQRVRELCAVDAVAVGGRRR